MLTIGVAAVAGLVTASEWANTNAAIRARFNVLQVSLIGVTLAPLAIGVLGVLAVSNEYTSGMIRATLAAVPKRLPVLWAKAAVFSAVTFLLMLPATVIGFLTTDPQEHRLLDR